MKDVRVMRERRGERLKGYFEKVMVDDKFNVLMSFAF